MNKYISNLPYLIDSPDVTDLYPAERFELRLYASPQREEDQQLQGSILDLNGIPHQLSKTEQPRQLLRIGVSQFDCFFVWQAEKSKAALFPLAHPNQLTPSHTNKRRFKPIPPTNWRRDVRKSCQLAIRSIYALGYDVGVVDVGIYPVAPRYRVVRLSNSIPAVVQKELEELIQKQHEAFYQDATPIMGADLEFVLRHKNGKFALASDYVSKLGRVGYDAIWLPNQKGKHPIAELRPRPDSDPLVLFKNVYACLLLAKRKINGNLSWLAGGHPLKGFPIGGHLHFSNIPLNSRLIRSLDNYLTLPLFILESQVSLTRRPKYGFLGDVREQFHGGFEYRTPPSWLVRPRVARGILCLSKVLTADYKNLVWMPTLNKDVQFSFYKGDKEYIYPFVTWLWQELKERCPSYALYQKELDDFYGLVQSRYEWDEFDDIRRWWKIDPS